MIAQKWTAVRVLSCEAIPKSLNNGSVVFENAAMPDIDDRLIEVWERGQENVATTGTHMLGSCGRIHLRRYIQPDR